MPNTKYPEKVLGVVRIDEKKTIVVTHLTIRQSIFFLHLKLIAIEIIAAIIIVLFHTYLFAESIRDAIGENFINFNLPIFLSLVFVKTFFTFVVILQWLNEYFEISGTELVHRRGLIFRNEERQLLEHIGSVEIDQGLLGRLFNYGTIKLYNYETERFFLIYLIHNPLKYYHILEDLVPKADVEKRIIREHFIEHEPEEA